jgi:hypothetical protein
MRPVLDTGRQEMFIPITVDCLPRFYWLVITVLEEDSSEACSVFTNSLFTVVQVGPFASAVSFGWRPFRFMAALLLLLSSSLLFIIWLLRGQHFLGDADEVTGPFSARNTGAFLCMVSHCCCYLREKRRWKELTGPFISTVSLILVVEDIFFLLQRLSLTVPLNLLLARGFFSGPMIEIVSFF